MNNEQHPCRRLIVEKDCALENSTDFTNLIVDDFNISMENTGVDDSWINGKNERQIIIIQIMVRIGIIESNRHENKWYCEVET